MKEKDSQTPGLTSALSESRVSSCVPQAGDMYCELHVQRLSPRTML